MTKPVSATDFTAATGVQVVSRDAFQKLTGVTAPGATAFQTSSELHARAVRKMKAGERLTDEEAAALNRAAAGSKQLSDVGVALQPFQALSDITKGLIGQLQGTQGSAARGVRAAAGHLTYGGVEYLPALTGARAQGITGAELLRGTKYEGNKLGILAVELLSDPSILLAGAGVAVKGAATAGRLGQLEALARTPEGAATVRGALAAANQTGNRLLRLSDEVTGVPAVARGVANSRAGQAAKAAASKVADVQLPGTNPLANAIRREGGGTLGDAFLTPDQKASIYTPQQVARDEFRTGVRLGTEQYAQNVKTAAALDAGIAANLVKGLGKADAAEVNRLLGVFTTATNPAVATEALRKLSVIGTRVGRNLEPEFVAAVKASDRIGQVTLGRELSAQQLPVVLNPKVTQAIQDAQSGADLIPLIGKYGDESGRPRGILMTSYVGRADPVKVVQDLARTPDLPAAAKVDTEGAARAIETSINDLPPLPPRPLEPVGVPAKDAPPLNPSSVAAEMTPPPTTLLEDFFRSADREVLPPTGAARNTLLSETLTPWGAGSVSSDISQVNSAADLANLGTVAGRGVTDSMYDMLHARYVAGETTELGQPSNVLIGAQSLKARGIELDRTQFQDFAGQFSGKLQGTEGSAARQAELRSFLEAYTPPAPKAVPSPAATPDLSATSKTPNTLLRELLSPGSDPYVALPSSVFTRTDPAALRDLALPAVAPERLVTRAVPTTYRTVEVDANALDWSALPDEAARRAVLNSIEGAGTARLIPDASGALRLNRPNLTVPLGHPTISRYFDDSELMTAQRQGTDLGERTIVRQEQVPSWYNPRDPAPMDVQRALHEQAVREAAERATPNDFEGLSRLHDALGQDRWVVGDAYASWERLVKPDTINTRAASNDYAARVRALTGTPPTRGEVFQYRLALARYRRAANLRNLGAKDAADHLTRFYRENPEATLYEGALSTARAFDLGTEGAKHLQKVLNAAESGFERRMSRLEKLEFAQYLAGKDSARRGGGLLVDRLKRRPEAVSKEFEQVFEQDINALRLIDDQVRTRTAAIVRQDTFRQYRTYLEDTGQLVTQRRLRELQQTPAARLTPDQRALREAVAAAVTRPGAPASWKILDRNVEGFFQKGDIIPWWAYFDLFGASGVDDTAVAAAILNRGGLDTYNRLWSTMNAQLLGTPTSIVNDQIGQLLQMSLWGVTPDAVIEGIIRRFTASPEDLAVMRKSGIQSAKLESNLGSEREALTRLAQRLEGDTDMTRMERIVDGVLRFRERGTGIAPQAMTGAAGVAADVAHLGSGYLFQARSMLSDLQRESLYFHRLQLGDQPAQAARYANDVLMDMRLVPAYARVVRKVWPFFNWIAMSAPRSVITVLRKPSLNAAYQRLGAASDNSDAPGENTRRTLARDGGYINLGIDERGGARLYLDPRNWDPTNTIPQLLDWSGTKVGAVGLPWYANLLVSLQWGQDRFGRNIYDTVLDGGTGGFTEAYRVDRKATLVIAAKTIHQQFNPSYAPGSPRAQAFVRSILATAELPQDGSRDVSLAHFLTSSPQGRAYLLFMQSGTFAAVDRDLQGVRDSPYTDAAPSVLRAATNFLLPLRAVNPDQTQQGTALQAVSVEKLRFQAWLAGERKRLAVLEAGGATSDRIQEEEDRINREAERRGAKLDFLDTITR